MLDEDYPILLSIQQAARKVGKSEKTIRRWIAGGMTRLHEVNRAEAARAACDSYHTHVTKEWHEQSELATIRLQVSIMEGQIEYLRVLADTQQEEIEALQRQVKKLLPKPATRKKTPTRRKRDEW